MTTTATLTPEALWQRLPRSSPPAGYCIAYSGGRDSHVLLHLMAALRSRLAVPLRAVHINHGLQAPAVDWAEHCRAVCAALAIPLTVQQVRCDTDSTHSLEEVARNARYDAFRRILNVGEILLIAHHRDDQAETVLLRLLRGAGAHGLAAMPRSRPLGRGQLLRPLLDVPAAAIVGYAQAQELRWVEDPSNRDERFDRNFLRYRLLPQLAERWPSYGAPLLRAAEHAREAAELIDALAQLDLAACVSGAGLDLDRLRALDEPRQRNLLRLWLRQHGLRALSQQRLQAGLRTLLDAGPDRMPELAWDGARLRRYRNRLLLDAADQPPLPAPRLWDLVGSLDLGDGRMWIAEPTVGTGLRQDLCGRQVQVRFRQGGERCRPVGDSHSRSLKKLLQQHGVPPWERPWLPLIYVDGELAVVADLWICEGFQATAGEAGIRLARIVNQRPF